MDCSWLDAYFDQELDLRDSLDMEAHLRECGDCQLRLKNYALMRESLQQARYAAPRSRHPAWRAGLAAASLFLCLGGWFWLGQFSDQPRLRQALVDQHVQALLAAHTIDVTSSDRHTVKPWFQGKLDYSPPVTDLAEQGFELTGGRLDRLQGRLVAVIVYARRKHVVDVFEWPDESPDLSPRLNSTRGYQSLSWRRNNWSYAAVSDLNGEELKQLSQLLP